MVCYVAKLAYKAEFSGGPQESGSVACSMPENVPLLRSQDARNAAKGAE